MNSANFKITFTLTSHLFYHQTALHIAAKEGQEVTVKHLVKKGADINIKDNNGVGIWDYAIDDTLPKNLIIHTPYYFLPQCCFSKGF